MTGLSEQPTRTVAQWFVLETSIHEEESVSRTLTSKAIEHFLPMEVRAFKASRRGPTRMMAIEVPLLPGLMFVMADIETAINIPNHVRHAEEIWCDGHGSPLVLSRAELLRFQSEVQSWLSTCRESIAKGRKPPPKPKALKIKLGEAGARDAIMQKLFGIAESEAA